jgi:hypothetical protein
MRPLIFGNKGMGLREIAASGIALIKIKLPALKRQFCFYVPAGKKKTPFI